MRLESGPGRFCHGEIFSGIIKTEGAGTAGPLWKEWLRETPLSVSGAENV